jgi:hypothetical protein
MLPRIVIYLFLNNQEDQFGFRRGKGTRDAIGRLRIISERTLEIEEETCVCFTDWQKAFDRVNWTKLMQLLKGTGIDWRERRLISNLYTPSDKNPSPCHF